MTATVLSPYHIGERIAHLYRQGLQPGDRTGWPSLDKHYTIAPGHVSLVTGWPSSGKSEWLDALLVNLMHNNWRICMFSPENRPQELHAAKVMEKIVGLPFGHGPNQRMTFEDVQGCMEILNGRLGLMDSDDEGSLSVKEIFEASEAWFASNFRESETKYKRGVVIDPWNELEHWRPAQMSETEYISKTLSYVRNWARRTDTRVWIVAHPRNIARENGKLPVPRPDMISGSQHWWNKADCNITVWRSMDDMDSQVIDIHVQKIRFKHIGRPGVVSLLYDRVTGRYNEPAQNVVNIYDKGKK